MLSIATLIILILKIAAVLVVITVFEFSKAVISTVLGDTKPKENKWLTLNPLKFFEPIGFLLFLFYGYGWGHSAETSTLFYRDRKKGVLMTYGLPIVICLALGMGLAFINSTVWDYIKYNDIFMYAPLFISFISRYFINIAIFNIIPINPMAGSRILKLFLNPNAAMRYTQNERLYQMVFMFAWFLGIVPQILNKVTTGIFGLFVY